MLKFIRTFVTSYGSIFTLSGMNKPKSVPLLFNCSSLFVPFSTVSFIILFVHMALK